MVDVELDFQDGHRGFHLVEVARGSIDRLWHIFEHQIEIDFILLFEVIIRSWVEMVIRNGRSSYTFTIGVVKGL